MLLAYSCSFPIWTVLERNCHLDRYLLLCFHFCVFMLRFLLSLLSVPFSFKLKTTQVEICCYVSPLPWCSLLWSFPPSLYRLVIPNQTSSTLPNSHLTHSAYLFYPRIRTQKLSFFVVYTSSMCFSSCLRFHISCVAIADVELHCVLLLAIYPVRCRLSAPVFFQISFPMLRYKKI